MDDRSAFAAAQQRVEELTEKIAKEKNIIADSQAKIASHDKELADLQSWISLWHKLTGTENPTASERMQAPEPQKSARAKNPAREEVVERTLEIIRGFGVPLSRKTIFDALAARGITIYGKDPEMVLSTMLWRSQDKIVRLPNHGYWPTDKAYPDANYDPDPNSFTHLLNVTAQEPEGGMEADDADD